MEQKTRRALFAQAMCDILEHRNTELFSSSSIQDGFKIIERDVDDTLINTEDANALVPVTVGDIIEPLEKGLVIDKLGIKMQSGLVGDYVLPAVSAIEATLEGENTELTESTIKISKLKAEPKRIALSVPVSKRAISQSNYSLMDIVIKQMSMGAARLLNKWLLSGTAVKGASNGPFVKDAAFEYTDGITLSDIIMLEAEVINTGVDVADGTAAYVCTPKVYGALKTTAMDAGSGRFLVEDGYMNGYPVLVSNYVDADALCFGVFSNVTIGQFGEMDFVVDPYTQANKNIVNFVLNSDYDILVVRPEAFAIAKKKA